MNTEDPGNFVHPVSSDTAADSGHGTVPTTLVNKGLLLFGSVQNSTGGTINITVHQFRK